MLKLRTSLKFETMVETPVLFETYIRVETSRKVWDAIKNAKPKKLYFYSNKALLDRPDDIAKNNEIRSWVREVDWDCEVHTFFRDVQVNQYESLLGSKQWLFDNEESGIILEDDCVPSLGFFEFCDHFLNVYADNKKISFISGNNYSRGYSPQTSDDHIISLSQLHFGWATWKDRWNDIDWELMPTKVIDSGAFEVYYPKFYVRWFYKLMFKRLEPFIKNTHCWDYLWTLNCIYKDKYEVSPTKNLVQNIGLYGEHANGGNNYLFKATIDADSHYDFKDDTCSIIPNYEYDYYELKSLGNRCSLLSKIRLCINYIKYLSGTL